MKQRERQPAWAVVGQGYIVKSRKTTGDLVNFDYTEGSSRSQSTALGIGISGYGFDAGFNAAGTHSSTASDSEGFPSERQNAWFRTLFSTGQFRGLCYGPPRDSHIPHEKQHGQCPSTFKGANLKASFNSSAQTGYDKNAVMDYHFGHFGFLCGTNNKPPKAAILVQRGTKP